MTFHDVHVCTLPRESRIVFVLYGVSKQPVDGQSNDSMQNNSQHHQEGQLTKVELGFACVQFFDFDRQMIQGSYFLSLWPPSDDKYYCPAPSRGSHPQGGSCPVLSVEIPNYGGQLSFPEISTNKNVPKLDFECLDRNLQAELIDTIDQGFRLNQIDKREVLWEKRSYLHSFPKALPKVLNVAHNWDYATLSDLHGLIDNWTPLKPLEAIELLLPNFPDLYVREQAVKWISRMNEDELADYLPQLLQALKFDCYEASPLSCFLLGRSLDVSLTFNF
jgi:phosphatidylinositol-4-phosphate 3-kinase